MLISGIEFIDKKLNNLDNSIITTIYGMPGIGKTTLCFLYCNSCVKKGKNVIYLDTEGGFSAERLLQINPKINLKKIHILKATNFEEQTKHIKNLNKHINKEVGLIIIDSLVMLYRLKLKDEPRKINAALAQQLMLLNEIARKHNIPIIMTNQVYSDFETKAEKMVGGTLVKYWSKTIIKLTKEEDTKRIYLEKHKSKKSDLIGNYELVNKGIQKTRSFLF